MSKEGFRRALHTVAKVGCVTTVLGTGAMVACDVGGIHQRLTNREQAIICHGGRDYALYLAAASLVVTSAAFVTRAVLDGPPEDN